MLEPKKHTGVMFDGTEYWCKIWRKTTCAFKSDMKNVANSNFILESEIAELNQNKNSKTTISTRCSVKTLFYLRNKCIAQLTLNLLHMFYRNIVLKVQEKF